MTNLRQGKRNGRTRLILWCGVLLGCLLLTAAAMAEDPLQFTMTMTPDALYSPATVRVAIEVTNTASGGAPVLVTLCDPDGMICTGFGAGGTANLAAGATVTYTGIWTVNEAQLNAGKVIYSARYTMTLDGQPMSANHPITKSVSRILGGADVGLVAKLDVARSISPGTEVAEGEQVDIAYRFHNVGTADIMDIRIDDSCIPGGETVKYPLLRPGEMTDLMYSIVAGTEDIQTAAEISYTYADPKGGKVTKTGSTNPMVITVTPLKAVEISPLRVESTAVAEAALTEKSAMILPIQDNRVPAGAEVTIAHTLTNTGAFDLKNITITDPDVLDGQILIPLLKAGASTGTLYRFTMAGGMPQSSPAFNYTVDDGASNPQTRSEYGIPVAFQSGGIQGAAVLCASKRSVAPGEEIVLTLTFVNDGATVWEQVRITDDALGDIDSGFDAKPGETITISNLVVMIKSETFQWTIEGVDSAGNPIMLVTNPVIVTVEGAAGGN